MALSLHQFTSIELCEALKRCNERIVALTNSHRLAALHSMITFRNRIRDRLNNLEFSNIFTITLPSVRDIHESSGNTQPIQININTSDSSQGNTFPVSRGPEWFAARTSRITASSMIGSIRSDMSRVINIIASSIYGQIGARTYDGAVVGRPVETPEHARVVIVYAGNYGEPLTSTTLAAFHIAGTMNSSAHVARFYCNPCTDSVKSNLYTGKIMPKFLKKYQNKTCSICCDLIEVNKRAIVSVTNCDHVFHPCCINKWIESYNFNGCPDCRGKLDKQCYLHDELEIYKSTPSKIKVKYPRKKQNRSLSKYTFKRYPKKCY